MTARRSAIATASALGILALVAGWSARRSPPAPVAAPVPNRVAELRRQVEQQEQESAEVVASYAPEIIVRLDDLAVPADPLLRKLPGVVRVKVAVRAERPSHRIVHLRDWHYVPKDLYAIDVKNAAGLELSDEEIERLHEKLCLEVEAVQLEQMVLLQCLIRHHGLKRLYCEGLTGGDLPSYRERIAGLRSMEREQIPRIRRQLEDVRELKKGMEPGAGERGEGYEKAAAIEKQITGLLWDHRKHLLELGAAGRLLIAGEIEEVLPLDEAVLLEQGKPVTPDGKVKFDPVKVAARRDGIVRAATDYGPLALVVLGGSHDLSESVRRVGGGRCEYIRVTTRRFAEFSE